MEEISQVGAHFLKGAEMKKRGGKIKNLEDQLRKFNISLTGVPKKENRAHSREEITKKTIEELTN